MILTKFKFRKFLNSNISRCNVKLEQLVYLAQKYLNSVLKSEQNEVIQYRKPVCLAESVDQETWSTDHCHSGK